MRESKGFTLIELMLVMVIIGILAGMVVVNYAGYGENARKKAAAGDIATYSHAIDLYALQHNDKYPRSLQELAAGDHPLVKQYRLDPWKKDYVYVCPGRHHTDSYDLYSCGPDGQPGTADDITNWETGSSGAPSS